MQQAKFDYHCQDFEDLLDVVDALYKNEMNKVSVEKHFKDLTFLAMHFSQLYVIITKCRSPHLRRRGLAILKSLPYSKDVWTRKLMTKVAERVIEIEEKGLEYMENELGTSFPPEDLRVHDINIISEMVREPKKCVVQFRQRRKGPTRFSRTHILLPGRYKLLCVATEQFGTFPQLHLAQAFGHNTSCYCNSASGM
ncbi:hypothetical protein B0J14DRAFT_571123 [Halenospora varia]|nr:hypothetical protein B0J14DRAFT_571123 [Halenospora varia]